ncbi:MAG: hypothetical protein QXK78_00720 [Candidatus Bathyarchaeia archaeon]
MRGIKKLKDNTRGQFVVVTSLLIAIVTLSLAFSVYHLNLHRRQLQYQPVEELVLGITSDLERCLTHALSVTTQNYYYGKSMETSIKEGYNFILKWARSVIASYSDLGVRMKISDVEWNIEWGELRGISQVWAKLELNIEAYNYGGWVGRASKFVSIEIYPESIRTSVQGTILRFKILQGTLSRYQPITNLTPESLDKTRIEKEDFSWTYPEVTDLTYLGDGVYEVQFNETINPFTYGVELTVPTPVDNIIVSATYRKHIMEVTLDSRESNNSTRHLGRIMLDKITYDNLPQKVIVNDGRYSIKYEPKNSSYYFLRWEWFPPGNFAFDDSIAQATNVTIRGNGTIIAVYTTCPPLRNNISAYISLLDQYEGSATPNTSSDAKILFRGTNYSLPAYSIKVINGTYSLQYFPMDGYEFLNWTATENIVIWNPGSSLTSVTINGNGTIIAFYRYRGYNPTTRSGSWDKLYLVKKAEESLLLPYDMLPSSYFNPRSSTLPIPPRPANQRENLNASSPPIPFEITLAKYVNVSIYVQLSSYKSEYITFELKFTYNGTTYLIGEQTFYNITGEGWYSFSIDTDKVDKIEWPVPGLPILPEGSRVVIAFILPPGSDTGHIIYGWNNYQSAIDLY